jgi:hypothetical protein
MSDHLTTTLEQDRKRVALQATLLRVQALLEEDLPPSLALTTDGRELLMKTKSFLTSEILLLKP